jgi:hypothetical protein
MPETPSTPGAGQEYVLTPEDDRMLNELLCAKKPEKHAGRRRRISDEIFTTIDKARFFLTTGPDSQKQVLQEPFSREASLEDEGDPIPVKISRIAATTLHAACALALDWKTVPDQQSKDEVLGKIVGSLVRQQEESPSSDADILIRNHPDWDGVMHELENDALRGGSVMRQLADGFDPAVQEAADDSFIVDAIQDRMKQIREIAAGIIQRVKDICSAERNRMKQEMANWHTWEDKIVVPNLGHIPMMTGIYNEVRIPPRKLSDLVGNPFLAVDAQEDVRNSAGFLHAPYPSDFEDMLRYGVTALVPNTGYYGVLVDQRKIFEYMANYCGYDHSATYETVDQLPKVSKKGWPVEWHNKKRALQMFKEMDRVAVSVEVAVRKTPAKQGAESRRDSGVATALKHYVYRHVPQPFIVTRHFEILEVDDKEVDPPLMNIPSQNFIQALGGVHLGAVEEEFWTEMVNGGGKPQRAKLKVLWHLCIAARDHSLRAMERGRRK